MQAAEAIQTLEPQTLTAAAHDVQVAREARIVEQKPAPAAKQDVEAMANLIAVPGRGRDGDDEQRGRRADAEASAQLAGDHVWDRTVRQWSPDWVTYDEYYRPVILNPYHDHPVQIIYVYQNAPRIVWIPPLARIALDVAQLAAYSFTALVLAPVVAAVNVANAVVDAAQAAVNVAVGSFFGGGYVPAAGLPLPPPPPPVVRYDNVPVQVRYSQAVYEPFRVNRIVDVGDDSVYGEHKVLLDGVTPAWGVWTQTSTGERQFEVHRTQQFPGLDDPREAPLPGNYQLQLASDESSTKLDAKEIYLVVAGGVVAVLGVGVLLAALTMSRRETKA